MAPGDGVALSVTVPDFNSYNLGGSSPAISTSSVSTGTGSSYSSYPSSLNFGIYGASPTVTPSSLSNPQFSLSQTRYSWGSSGVASVFTSPAAQAGAGGRPGGSAGIGLFNLPFNIIGKDWWAKQMVKFNHPVSFDFNAKLNMGVDALLSDSGNWIYNPYKSKYYDGFCYPAALFNDKKERQILCKRLGCLEAVAEKGGPLEACEFEYSLDMCMYVESARYKLEGPMTFGKFAKNFFNVMFNNILGVGVTVTYLFVFPGCAHLHYMGGYKADQGPNTSPGAVRNVLCGTIGSLMSLREILAYFNNPFNPIGTDSSGPPNLPATSYDYCKGGSIYQ